MLTIAKKRPMPNVTCANCGHHGGNHMIQFPHVCMYNRWAKILRTKPLRIGEKSCTCEGFRLLNANDVLKELCEI
jgi:hypothetical protein